MGLKEVLTNPDNVAKLTFLLAVTFSLLVTLSIIVVDSVQEYTVYVSGDIARYVKVRGVFSPPFSNNGLIFFSVRDPTNRPGIYVVDPIYPLVRFDLVNVDDTGTVVNGMALASTNITVKSKGNSIIVTYFQGNKVIANKIITYEGPNIILHGRVQTIQLDTQLVKGVDILNNGKKLLVEAYFPYLNFHYNLTLGFEGCKVRGYEFTANLKLLLHMNSSETCVLKLLNVHECFVGTTEYGERGCYDSPFISRILSFIVYGGLNYLVVILLPLTAFVLWKKVIAKNLHNFKGFLLYNLLLAFLGSITALHWDAVMSYIFASKAFNPIDLYMWTRANQIAVKLKIPSHYPMFAGYTYITPWIAFLLSPLSLLTRIFTPKGFLHVFSYDDFRLGIYLVWFFRSDYIIYYLMLGLWYMMFNIITYVFASKLFDKDKVLTFMYSPFLALISYYWKMFEPMLLALFVVMLYLLFDKKRCYVLSGGLAAVISTKVYTVFTIIPLLKTLSKREFLLGITGFMLFLVPAILTVTTMGLKRFLFVTLYYQSHREIAAINFFPVIFSEPLNIIRSLGNVSFILETLLVGYLFFELLKYSEIRRLEQYLVWGAVLMIPYMIFNKLVSPQNYLFLLFISYMLGLTYEASLLSLVLTLYVIFVFPSVFYFSLPLTPLMGKLYYEATVGLFYVTLMLYFNIVRPISWTVLITSLFAIDVILLAKLLRLVRKGRKVEKRAGR